MCACTRKKGGFSVAYLGAVRTLQLQAYILGEKWAGTGSAFKIKSADNQRAAPGAKTIPASAISVELSIPGKGQRFTVSMQNFVDSVGDLWNYLAP
jgi:hypothetical protein